MREVELALAKQNLTAAQRQQLTAIAQRENARLFALYVREFDAVGALGVAAANMLVALFAQNVNRAGSEMTARSKANALADAGADMLKQAATHTVSKQGIFAERARMIGEPVRSPNPDHLRPKAPGRSQ